ncbi:transcriptional regulator, partial [Streptomyces sp. NPDC100445]
SRLGGDHGASFGTLPKGLALGPVLARLPGRAVAVDRDGWTATVTGMPYVRRVALPKGIAPGRHRLPALGTCAVEPLAGGWLLRARDEPLAVPAARIVLDLARPDRRTLTVVAPSASWTREVSPRHAELLFLLAEHPAGRGAAGLAEELFGDASRTVTVRAEMSGVRRYLGGFLQHRPYRFHAEADVEVLLPGNSRDLLPRSAAPAVARRRRDLGNGHPGPARGNAPAGRTALP